MNGEQTIAKMQTSAEHADTLTRRYKNIYDHANRSYNRMCETYRAAKKLGKPTESISANLDKAWTARMSAEDDYERHKDLAAELWSEYRDAEEELETALKIQRWWLKLSYARRAY